HVRRVRGARAAHAAAAGAGAFGLADLPVAAGVVAAGVVGAHGAGVVGERRQEHVAAGDGLPVVLVVQVAADLAAAAVLAAGHEPGGGAALRAHRLGAAGGADEPVAVVVGHQLDGEVADLDDGEGLAAVRVGVDGQLALRRSGIDVDLHC